MITRDATSTQHRFSFASSFNLQENVKTEIQRKTMRMKKITACVLVLSLAGCATSPQVVVDPKSIKDVVKYDQDLAECKAVSEGYDASGATAGSAMLGAGAAVGTAALVLATGGLYLLPAGIAVAGAGGAAVGGGISKNKEGRAREKIWAECMNERGYKAYTSN